MKNFRKYAAAAGVALLSLGAAKPAVAQNNSTAKPVATQNSSTASGYFEITQSEHADTSYIRPNILYRVFGLDAYTFIEFYRREGFFGKTSFMAGSSRLRPRSEFVYGSATADRVGFGVNYSLPMPRGASLSVKLLPFWVNGNGYVHNRVMTGYSGNAELPFGFEASAFADINLGARGGPEWGYGEIFLGKKLPENVSVGYAALLKDRGPGVFLPRVEHAAMVKIGL